MLDYNQVPRRFYRHGSPAISGKAIVEGLRKGKWRNDCGGAGMNLRAELFFAGLSRNLVICEGVESAIAAAKLFDCPAWEMCGPFPASLRLPSFVKHVLIADVRSGTAHRRRRGQHAPFRQRGERDDDALLLAAAAPLKLGRDFFFPPGVDRAAPFRTTKPPAVPSA